MAMTKFIYAHSFPKKGTFLFIKALTANTKRIEPLPVDSHKPA
jgi:hypothetical protein